jgi:pimeloyl-ACP methyl ester carboxylesterase
METTTVNVPGADLFVDSEGTGSPLVLIHGSGADASTWAGVIPRFSGTHKVISYDRRGYGRSTHAPVRDHRIHARDLVAVLESLGEPADVVGWSSGGVVALDAVTSRPELFRSLTVIEAPLHGMSNAAPGVIGVLLRAKLAQLTGRKESGAATFYRFASGTRDGSSGFDRLTADGQGALLTYSNVVLNELSPHRSGSLGEHVAYEDLAKVSVPLTWILGGDSIPWYETLATRAVEAVPAIRLVSVPGASHLLHLEKPDAFEAEVRRAIAGDVRAR